MREVAKRKKIQELFLENDFMPVTLNGVEYLPNVQAVLYNYFQTMTTYPVYVNSDNHQDAKELINLSFELGGFPLIDPVFEPSTSRDVQLKLH
jgi:hypothetical protein